MKGKAAAAINKLTRTALMEMFLTPPSAVRPGNPERKAKREKLRGGRPIACGHCGRTTGTFFKAREGLYLHQSCSANYREGDQP